MALVNYSSSEEDDNDLEHVQISKKPRLLLPNAIKHITFGKTNIHEDDVPEDRDPDGKLRNFPHERGNWVTYVYVPCLKTDLMSCLQSDIIAFCKDNYSLTVKPIESLHISLTRTVVLKHHWINSFIESVKLITDGLRKTSALLNQINVYCNDECSRTFIGISIAAENCDTFRLIVPKLDKCLAEYKLPFFYKDASFHVSILWCLGNEKKTFLNILHDLQTILDKHLATDSLEFQLNVDGINCKTGNKVYTFPFN